MLLSIRPNFPSNCSTEAQPIVVYNADAHIERMTLNCTDGLEGREITIDGLAAP